MESFLTRRSFAKKTSAGLAGTGWSSGRLAVGEVAASRMRPYTTARLRITA